jgi:hypothetical protein
MSAYSAIDMVNLANALVVEKRMAAMKTMSYRLFYCHVDHGQQYII